MLGVGCWVLGVESWLLVLSVGCWLLSVVCCYCCRSNHYSPTQSSEPRPDSHRNLTIVSVWHRRELESLQAAALELAKSEGMEAEYADISLSPYSPISEALAAGYCRPCNEHELGGVDLTQSAAGSDVAVDGDGGGDGGGESGSNSTQTAQHMYSHARYCLVETPLQRTETLWITPNGSKLGTQQILVRFSAIFF